MSMQVMEAVLGVGGRELDTQMQRSRWNQQILQPGHQVLVQRAMYLKLTINKQGNNNYSGTSVTKNFHLLTLSDY